MIQPTNFANSPRCQHLKLNGSRCAAPARRHRQFCVFHEAAHSRKPEDDIRLVEDAMSLQLALAQVIRDLSHSGPVNTKRAALKLYALQISSSNLRRLHQELLDCDMDLARRKWLENYLQQNKVTPDLKREILADFDAEFLSPRVESEPEQDVAGDPQANPPTTAACPERSRGDRRPTTAYTPGRTQEPSPGREPLVCEPEVPRATDAEHREAEGARPVVIPSLHAMASPEKPYKQHRHFKRAGILRLGRAPSLRMTSGEQQLSAEDQAAELSSPDRRPESRVQHGIHGHRPNPQCAGLGASLRRCACGPAAEAAPARPCRPYQVAARPRLPLLQLLLPLHRALRPCPRSITSSSWFLKTRATSR